MSETEAFEQMRSDHRHVLDRVASLEAVTLGAGGRKGGPEAEAELRETLALMRQQFATHMAAEDEVLFPSLVETLPETRPSVAPLEAEHLELRDMLSRLESTLDEPPRPDRDE